MTRMGHTITGLALATAFTGFREPGMIVGVLLGCTAPDYLEMPYRDRRSPWGIERVIPHRTLTHWPLLWVGLLLVGLFLPMGGLGQQMPLPSFATHLQWCVTGFAAGGLMHLFCDWMTPMGIPWRRPFGKRHSLRVYRTGGLGELLMVLIIGVCCIGVGYWNIARPL